MAESDRQRDRIDWQNSVYDQLHRLAQGALNHETPGHSLQPTMLVNDAYLKLLEQNNVDPEDRSQVMAAGAVIIRRLLVDYARRRNAKKRGGPEKCRISLPNAEPDAASEIDVLELHDALNVFSENNPRAAKVVELKFFGGLTSEEIAAELNVSSRTVGGDWQFAKAWLYSHMDGA